MRISQELKWREKNHARFSHFVLSLSCVLFIHFISWSNRSLLILFLFLCPFNLIKKEQKENEWNGKEWCVLFLSFRLFHAYVHSFTHCKQAEIKSGIVVCCFFFVHSVHALFYCIVTEWTRRTQPFTTFFSYNLQPCAHVLGSFFIHF